MGRLFAVIALLFAFTISPFAAPDWSAVVKQVEKSVVFIEIGSEGSCTGFIIDATRHYVMTAAHCQPSDHSSLWVDRVAARVVSLDSKKDLMVVEVKDIDPSLPALVLAHKNPERGQDVMSCGFGMGLERAFFRQAHVQDDQTSVPETGQAGTFVSLDSAFVGGQSGGPVVNAAGEVVMIVQRASNTVGIGVGADVIRERMGRFFGK